MKVCPETELIAIEDPAAVCDGSFEIGERFEAQAIRHMRHGSSPRTHGAPAYPCSQSRKILSDSISRSPYDWVIRGLPPYAA